MERSIVNQKPESKMIEKKSKENKLSNIKYQKNDKVSISKRVDEPKS